MPTLARRNYGRLFYSSLSRREKELANSPEAIFERNRSLSMCRSQPPLLLSFVGCLCVHVYRTHWNFLARSLPPSPPTHSWSLPRSLSCSVRVSVFLSLSLSLPPPPPVCLFLSPCYPLSFSPLSLSSVCSFLSVCLSLSLSQCGTSSASVWLLKKCQKMCIFSNTAPVCLSDLLEVYTPPRQLRSSSDSRTLCSLHIQIKTFGHPSFSCAAASVWNSLPREIRPIRYIQSTTGFKSALKTYLFKSYLY